MTNRLKRLIGCCAPEDRRDDGIGIKDDAQHESVRSFRFFAPVRLNFCLNFFFSQRWLKRCQLIHGLEEAIGAFLTVKLTLDKLCHSLRR